MNSWRVLSAARNRHELAVSCASSGGRLTLAANDVRSVQLLNPKRHYAGAA
jgi:hypothetical protein